MCLQLVESHRDVEHRDGLIEELRSTCESSKVAELEADGVLQSHYRLHSGGDKS